MFVWAPDDLNEEQAAAVDEPGSVFLTACPGSGKTRTVAYRIARELSRLTSPKQRVVAITYTNRAAEEIHDRIDRLGVDTSQLWIGTIHAFCLQWILQPYGIYHPDLQHGFRIADAHDQERMITEHCKGSSVVFYDCGHFYTSTDLVLACPDGWKHTAIRQVLDRYTAQLKAERRIDYEQILSCAFDLIRDHPPISRLLGSIFTCILVDEYQDTKQIQYAILGRILRAGAGHARAFIVGDPNQAIFGSLGGMAMSREAFQLECGLTLRPMELAHNYRSSQRIVDYFGAYNRLTGRVEAVGKQKAYPSLISFDTVTGRDDLHDEIVRLIRFNIEDAGIPPREICVVGPQWPHLAATTRRLAAALPQYPFDGPGMIPFARDPENFWYRLARLVLTEPSPQLFVRRLRWAGEVLETLAGAGISVGLSRRDLLRACNTLQISETNGLAYLEQAFLALSAALGVVPTKVPVLQEHWDAFFGASAQRIARLVADGAGAIEEIGQFRQVFGERRGITVSTIHGVKGAEYDAVIAFALLEGMVPHFKDLDAQASAEKLLYVICSRPRKNLHLISERGRPRGASNVYQPTARLLRESFAYDAPPRPAA